MWWRAMSAPYLYQLPPNPEGSGLASVFGILCAIALALATAFYFRSSIWPTTVTLTDDSLTSTSSGATTSTDPLGAAAASQNATTGAATTATTGGAATSSDAPVAQPIAVNSTAAVSQALANLGSSSSGTVPLASGVSILPVTATSTSTPCDTMKSDPNYAGLFGSTSSYGGLVSTSVTPSSWTDDQRNTAITIIHNAYSSLAIPALQAMTNSALSAILQCTCPAAISNPFMSTPPASWTSAQRSAAIAAVGTKSAAVQPNEQLFSVLSCSSDPVPGYCGTTANYDVGSKTTTYKLVGNCPGSGALHF